MNNEGNGVSGWDAVVHDEALKRSTFTNATGQQYLWTTRDKVEIALLKFVDALKSRTNWHTPLGILCTLVATLPTTEFRSFILPADEWAILFTIATLGSAVWFAVTWRRSRQSNDVTIEALLEQLWTPPPKSPAPAPAPPVALPPQEMADTAAKSESPQESE